MSFKVKDLDKFHNQNPNISVSILILTNQLDLISVVSFKPFKPFTKILRQHHIDLLLVNNETNSHYILIKDVNAPFSKQKHNRY